MPQPDAGWDAPIRRATAALARGWRRVHERIRGGEDARWYRRWALGLTVVGIGTLGLLAVGGLFLDYYVSGSIPSADELRVPDPTVVYDAAGNRVATLDPAAVRKNIQVEDLPDHVRKAVLAAEDRGFYSHPGFSYSSIARAFLENLTAGRIEEGASTITQQYVELAVEEVDRSYLGKLREIALAIKMDRQFDKPAILENYLNRVEWGRGAIGIEAAARTYFGKSASQLSVNEAATLAGMIAAPSRFDPTRNPELADARRRYVLDGMVEQGWLEPQRAQTVIDHGLPEVSAEQAIEFGPNAYYLDAVRRDLERELGEDMDIWTGLNVFTELDPRVQELAQTRLREHLGETPYTGALVTIDHRNGAVRALVGGLDYAEQRFNAAIETAENQGENQPGSAFKPFALAGLVAAGYSPDEAFFDAPSQIEVEFDGFEPYEVRNFADAGFGRQSVREATLTSTNTVYVQLAREIGPQAVKQVAVAGGIEDDEDLRAVPSLVLGTAEVSVLQMAQAYGTFANEGVRHEPRLIRQVSTHHTNDIVLDRRPEGQETLAPNVARVVTDVLRDNIARGTGTAAQIGRPAAGKTGTTQDSRDAWFVGYTPQLTTAVWVGMLDNSPMDDVTGGSIPASIWGDYMAEVVDPMEALDFPEPDWSGLEGLDRDDEVETPQRTVNPTPGPSSPSPTPSPSPSPSPSPVPSPSPTLQSPSTSPTSEPTASPAPTSEQPTAEPTTSSPTPTSQTSSPSDGDGSTAQSTTSDTGGGS